MPYNSEGVGHRAIDTSRDAATGTKAPFWRGMVLHDLENNGAATADEVARRIGASPLTIRPRISELRNMGKVYDTGRRSQNASGKSAAVWSLTMPKGGA